MAKKIDKKIKEILKKMVDADIIKDLKQKNLSILFEVSQSVISELLIEIKSEYISNKIKNNLSKAKESNDSYIIFVWDKLLKVMNQNLSANERSSTDIDAENLYNNLLLQTLGNDIIVYRNVFDIYQGV